MPAGTVSVHLWAGARAAAGTGELDVEVPGTVSVAWVRDEVVRVVGGERLAAVLSACSVLVGSRPLGKADPASAEVLPGQTVEFLPPFAGG